MPRLQTTEDAKSTKDTKKTTTKRRGRTIPGDAARRAREAAAPRESLAQNTNRSRMRFVFSRGFYVAHAGRLRRPAVALGDPTACFVSFVAFVIFVVCSAANQRRSL